MKKIRRLAEFILLLYIYNLIPFFTVTEKTGLRWIVPVVLAGVYFAAYLLDDTRKTSSDKRKLRRIDEGCKLVRFSGYAAVTEIFILWVYIAKYSPGGVNIAFSIILPVLMIAITLFCGIVRISVSSKQIKLPDYILLLMLWWVPGVNIFLFRRFYKIAKREYIFESDRLELENARAENEICKTKYPVLMVHGIFFRDWQYFNYWGRIPAALIRNGATVFYGRQQSASSVERSARELRDRILEIIEETGAEKVNIIAHSKGGLDARYAISHLGMDKYTASLTTINTPHEGCDMVDMLLDKAPKSFVEFLADRYNRIFTRLGDKAPDFLAGVNDLRSSRAEEFNRNTPDSQQVVYRSYMTVMSSFSSAFFPLGVTYLLIKKLSGANDGLVSENSAIHGEHTLITPKKRRGISHGDVIDLMRENIEGYDVREFYVDILWKLKEQGL